MNQPNTLTINSNYGRTIGNLDSSFSSDLNQQIGKALLSNTSTEQQIKFDELKQTLHKKIEGLTSDNHSPLSQWLNWEKSAVGDLGSINEKTYSSFIYYLMLELECYC